MSGDAIAGAVSAAREAWQEVQDNYPSDDPDAKAAILLGIDNAILELEEAARLALVNVPE